MGAESEVQDMAATAKDSSVGSLRGNVERTRGAHPLAKGYFSPRVNDDYAHNPTCVYGLSTAAARAKQAARTAAWM